MDAEAWTFSSVSAPLARLVGAAIDHAGGWLPFSRFMAMVLYAPGLGYYASGRPIVGRMPESGSDFVTAPELSPLFAQALARQVAQALEASGSDEVWEFGAGSGALAAQLMAALGERVRRYSIVELSAPLRERQRAATARVRRARALARRAARHDGAASSSATRCSTRCRSTCCTSTAHRGSSAASRAARASFHSPGPIGRRRSGRRSRRRRSRRARRPSCTRRPRRSSPPSPTGSSTAPPSSSTTAFRRASTTTRSAPAAR